ncbi:MAG: NAD(P)H-dependent oxidoreductase subunit E [Anaerolineaceae bacterium]|nr:NAD(P)H-dependent oxidoreductase subunit E [Anaerolineaceae bacterium]
MKNFLENIPVTDPLAIPEQKAKIDAVLDANRDRPGATMVVLSELQNEIGYLSEPMQEYIAHELGVPTSAVHGVVTFYSFFTTTPRGKHTIKFCLGTACYVGGAQQLIEKAEQILNIKLDETTPDGKITIEACRCVGACSQAPVIAIDEELFGRLSPNKLPKLLKDYQD